MPRDTNTLKRWQVGDGYILMSNRSTIAALVAKHPELVGPDLKIRAMGGVLYWMTEAEEVEFLLAGDVLTPAR